MSKQCTKCLVEQPFTSFNKAKYGLQSWCIGCQDAAKPRSGVKRRSTFFDLSEEIQAAIKENNKTMTQVSIGRKIRKWNAAGLL